jgi:hypothetical protein
MFDDTRIRQLLAAVQRQLPAAAMPGRDVDPALDAPQRQERVHPAWAAVVVGRGVGPAPVRRECPYCGQGGMREATRCGYCWLALVPVPAR